MDLLHVSVLVCTPKQQLAIGDKLIGDSLLDLLPAQVVDLQQIEGQRDARDHQHKDDEDRLFSGPAIAKRYTYVVKLTFF